MTPSVCSAISRGNRWVTLLHSSPSSVLSLICLPYAGGGASIYRTWPLHLGDGIDVYGVQLPGRGSRISEPPIGSLAELVPALGAALDPLLHRAFAVFGHSMGALLGFELCRWLRTHRGVQPKHLFVSGRRAPQIRSNQPAAHNRSDEDFIAYLSELNGTPAPILASEEFRRLMLPTLRADFKLGETYIHTTESPLTCPITAFGGTNDEESHAGKLNAWEVHTNGTFAQHFVEGDHFFLHSQERELLSIIRPVLRQVVAECRGATNPEHAAAAGISR